MRFIPTALAATAFWCAAAAAAAQAPAGGRNTLVDAVVECRGQADPAARLACFDAAAAALGQASASGSIVVVDREDVRETRRSLFGFSVPKLPFFSGDDSNDEAPEEIEAPIRSVRSLGYGKFLFTLDNGAQWQTTEANNRPPDPKSGETLSIRKGALGAYFLSVEGRRSVKGRRVG